MKKGLAMGLTMGLVIIGAVVGVAIHTHFAKQVNSLALDIKVPTADNKPQGLKEIIYKTQKIVVQISTTEGLGSGFFFNENGDILTNAHVVSGYKEVVVTTADAKEYRGTVIGIGEQLDIALIRVEELKGTPYLSFKEKRGEIGDEILALGSPMGLQNTVTNGIISGVGRDLDIGEFHYEDAYQISAPIAHGNSGGPLIDAKTGELMGINSAGADEGTIGFSIPITSVKKTIEGWVQNPMDIDGEVADVGEMGTEDLEENGQYLVAYYFDSINNQDYVSAYAMLGSKWHEKEPFDQFMAGFSATLAVEIENMETAQSGENVTVTVVIRAQERTKSGGVTTNRYRMQYLVGVENDMILLISGTGEKL